MTKEERIKNILRLLDKEYGKEQICFLNYKKDYELLFATILAAQCTDNRVNEVTKVLFKKYKSLKQFASCDIKELEEIVKPCGFYSSKAKNIFDTANILLEKYDGIVPSDIDELVKLKGVGRKTANVIRTNIYNIPSIVCDTHVIRTSNLLGLGTKNDPKLLEKELEKNIPIKHWSRLNPQLMSLGRTYCNARKKQCDDCFLNKYCLYNEKNNKQNKKTK
ncbi:MAG: endonuclease III [Clostridia bacterium]|nr:endonuclease III [Clostridia bacterium]